MCHKQGFLKFFYLMLPHASQFIFKLSVIRTNELNSTCPYYPRADENFRRTLRFSFNSKYQSRLRENLFSVLLFLHNSKLFMALVRILEQRLEIIVRLFFFNPPQTMLEMYFFAEIMLLLRILQTSL